MFNPHTKFEVSTITCNEEMKGNAKCSKSPLPLTDPRDAEAQRMLNIPHLII